MLDASVSVEEHYESTMCCAGLRKDEMTPSPFRC